MELRIRCVRHELTLRESDSNPFRYAGQYYDKETGTYYLRARYYDPSVGRFTQQDGWQFADPSDPLSLNLYTYCLNDPIQYCDTNGHSALAAAEIWTASSWWLTLVDGPLPIGDIIYGVGIVVVLGVVTSVAGEVDGNISTEVDAPTDPDRRESAPPKANDQNNKDRRSLPPTGKPNSSADLYDENGKLKQRRYYGPDGKAQKDIDYDHQDSNDTHEFPHEHTWDWSKTKHPRSKPKPLEK